MKNVISTENAPGAIGPYSQAIRANGFVFVSGQIPLDPATGAFVPGGVEEQAEQCLKNLTAVLAAAMLIYKRAAKKRISPILLIIIAAGLGMLVHGV